MTRVFPVLALFSLACVAAVMILGFSLGDVRDPEDVDTQRQATVHRLAGISAGIVVILANSIVVTYFIGTSRWTREVCETYKLDRSLVIRANKHKRLAFPFAVLNMLVAVAMVALGGAADPGAMPGVEPIAGISWANLHLAGAIVGATLITLGFYLQWSSVFAHRGLIAEIMQHVRRIRIERGLESDEAA